MLKKTMTYTDFDGNQKTEDFYFNLTSAEVAEWLTTTGGYTLDKVLDRLVRTENTQEVLAMFKDLITRAYGEKSLDGRSFVKSDEVRSHFIYTQAFSDLYMELLSDPKVAANFFNSIIPKDMSNDVAKLMSNSSNVEEAFKDYAPAVAESAKQIAESTFNNVTPIS